MTSIKNNNNTRLSSAMERTGQWILSPDVPSDVIVEVGEANFSLHKFMLIAKSNFIRRVIMESKEPDLTRINLTGIPGGVPIFEKAAKFCYGVNFEITVHNIAALICAAEFLEMTDKYSEGNLAGRTEDFLTQVALTSFSASLIVLKTCEDLLPLAEELNIVQRCVAVVSAKACNEANFPSRAPTDWWTDELTILNIDSFKKVIFSMKSRGAKTHTLSSALITYTERSLRDLVRDHSGQNIKSLGSNDVNIKKQQQNVLETIVSLLPTEKAILPVNFVCCLLRSAIFLNAATSCKNDLEKRIGAILEHVTVDDLLVVSFNYDVEKLFDLESVRRIISAFVEKDKSVTVFSGADYKEMCSTSMQRVAKTVDAYLSEIATYAELSISKFNGIAHLIPKAARKVDDDLYRAIDIYLKAHPNLDEIEREKVCSVMDPLKLSYEARVHASQNKRLPVQVVLPALYYDQLMLRSGVEDRNIPDAITTRNQLQTDVSLANENEVLRTELLKMKMYVSNLQKNQVGESSKVAPKKTKFFSSMSKTLVKLNPFRHGSKDTSNIDEFDLEVTKPRRRRFSLS
ncbi:ATPase of 26S proteasome regulatory subunit 4 [Ranunculus cassubicifolius]